MNKVKVEITIGYEDESQMNKAMSMAKYLRLKSQDYAATWNLKGTAKISHVKDHTAV